MADEAARARIEAALAEYGWTAEDWREGSEGLEALVGRFRAIEDDEDNGIFAGDEGELTACVVGAASFGNERVSFMLKPDGLIDGNEVQPDQVEEA